MIGGADENQISADLYLLEIGMNSARSDISMFRANEMVEAHRIGRCP